MRVSFFRDAGIPAPVDGSPLLTTAELSLRTSGNVNNRKNRGREPKVEALLKRRGLSR